MIIEMLPKNMTSFLLQRYWRLTRSMTLGVQGLVIDPKQRILLVRHAYRTGWHFPGGGVEKKENALAALTRELQEEAGILIEEIPQLFGLYTNFQYFSGDHIALFIVRSWRQPLIPPPNKEIADQGFFSINALPKEVHASVINRIQEIFYSKNQTPIW